MVVFVSCRELALMAAAAALGGAVVAASFAITNPKRAFCRKQRLRLSFWRNVACLLRLPTYPDQMTHLLDSQCSTCSYCSHIFAFPVSKDQDAISRSELCLDNADPKETKLLPEGCIDHMTLVACNEEQKVDPFDPSKRKGYLSWDDYFMAIAFLSAHRSKDPNRQVGACLVSQNRVILGIGYNGFPRGCSDDALPWAKISATGDPLQTKYPYVCHAEVNAILNKNHASAAGQRLYVTMFPCNECAKIIIQAGVAEVVYFRDVTSDYLYTASRRLLSMAGVKLWRHQPTRTQLLLDFK